MKILPGWLPAKRAVGRDGPAVAENASSLDPADRVSLAAPTAPSLSRLGGNAPVRNELKSLLQLVEQGQPFPHQSYLIAGDSGTGTTTLATALAQDLAPYGVTTLITSGGEMLQKGQEGLTDLFRQAHESARQSPAQTAVIVMDDVDSAFPPRMNTVSEPSINNHQMLGIFMHESANLVGEDGTRVLLVGTSSRPDSMDWSAKDRFQRGLVVQTPGNAQEREEVLQSLVDQRQMPAPDPVALRELAEATRGAKPSRLAEILDMARKNSPDGNLDASALQLARLEQSYGPAVVKVIPEWAFRLTACHELGHAVTRHLFQSLARQDEMPLAIDLISLIPRQNTEAAVELKYNGNPTKTLEYYAAEITSNYGGRAAEMLFGDGHLSAGVGNDLQFATSSAREAVLEKGMGATLGDLQPGQSGIANAYEGRAQADIDRLLKTSEHLAVTIIHFYRPIIEEMASEFAAHRDDPARLVLSGTHFHQRLAAWEQADPERARQVEALRGYVRQKVESLRPPALQAWDPATGNMVPIGTPRS